MSLQNELLTRSLSEHAIAGVSVSHASIGLSDSGSAGTTGGGTTSVGLHAAASSAIVYGAAAAQYTFSSLSVRRTDSSGQLSPGTVRAGVLVGHFIDLSGFTFAPVGELEYVHTDSQTVSESGAGKLTADVPGRDTLTSRVGIRINSAFYRCGILGTPFVSVLWEHQLQTVVMGSGVSPLALGPSDGTITFGVTAKVPGDAILGVEFGDRFGGRVDERTVRFSLARSF